MGGGAGSLAGAGGSLGGAAGEAGGFPGGGGSDATMVSEKIRALAARCLLGLARDPSIKHILAKLQVREAGGGSSKLTTSILFCLAFCLLASHPASTCWVPLQEPEM